MVNPKTVRAIFVGQAPSRSTGSLFESRSGLRLAKLLGVELESLRRLFAHVNVLPSWPGKHGGSYGYREKGDRFPIGEARERARRLASKVSRYPAVVFLGPRVARAFDVSAVMLAWTTFRGTRALVVPHPSGCNQWWNDAANVEAAKRALSVLSGAEHDRRVAVPVELHDV